jgi:hypothetical protein
MNVALIYIGSLVSSLLAGFGAAVIYLALHEWFGSGDLYAFGFWSLLFSVLVSLLAIIYSKRFEHWSIWLRYTLASLLGLGLGIGWAVAVAFVLGPFFLQFSFPVVYFWMLGGMAAFVFCLFFNGRIAPNNSPNPDAQKARAG